MKKSRVQWVVLPAGLLSAGCRNAGARSSTIDVVGSYFPAWMVCILLGLAITVIVHQLLVGFKLAPYVRPAPLVYLSMAVLWSMVVWLVFFKN
jgi:hypothetical protein